MSASRWAGPRASGDSPREPVPCRPTSGLTTRPSAKAERIRPRRPWPSRPGFPAGARQRASLCEPRPVPPRRPWPGDDRAIVPEPGCIARRRSPGRAGVPDKSRPPPGSTRSPRPGPRPCPKRRSDRQRRAASSPADRAARPKRGRPAGWRDWPPWPPPVSFLPPPHPPDPSGTSPPWPPACQRAFQGT